MGGGFGGSYTASIGVLRTHGEWDRRRSMSELGEVAEFSDGGFD
jgi:hypothetical protein